MYFVALSRMVRILSKLLIIHIDGRLPSLATDPSIRTGSATSRKHSKELVTVVVILVRISNAILIIYVLQNIKPNQNEFWPLLVSAIPMQ